MFRHQTLARSRQSLAGSHSLTTPRFSMSTASSQHTLESLVKDANRESEYLTRISQETLELERKAHAARFGYRSVLLSAARGMWGVFGVVVGIGILDDYFPSLVEPLRGVLTGSRKLRNED